MLESDAAFIRWLLKPWQHIIDMTTVWEFRLPADVGQLNYPFNMAKNNTKHISERVYAEDTHKFGSLFNPSRPRQAYPIFSTHSRHNMITCSLHSYCMYIYLEILVTFLVQTAGLATSYVNSLSIYCT